MTKRIERLRKALESGEVIVSAERGKLLTESYKQTDGEPPVWRRAKAFFHVLNNVSIFIEDDELLVGNTACQPRGVDVIGTFPEGNIEARRKSGWIIPDEEVEGIKAIHEYWLGRNIHDLVVKRERENERVWELDASGIRFPAPASKELGTYEMTARGWNLGREHGCLPDYEKVLTQGLNSLIEEAEEEIKNTRLTGPDSFEKVDFLKSVIISLQAIITFANRFSALASDMAAKEANPKRKKELLHIAEVCKHVPAHPARTFYEALQSYWFIIVTVLGTNAFMGRFDQFMYPFYKKGIEEKKLTDEEALELIQCLRLKISQLHPHGKRTIGVPMPWVDSDNMIIGGQTADGSDATNALTYLVLEATKQYPIPFPALILRVHGDTPDALMMKTMELLKAGNNMPAFLGDNSSIEYLLNEGVPLKLARDYAATAGVEVCPVGRARFFIYGQFSLPLVLSYFLNDSVGPLTGKQLGPKVKTEEYRSFDELMAGFEEYLEHLIKIAAEWRSIVGGSQRDQFPDPPASALSHNGIKAGKDIFNRVMPFENGAGINYIGAITAVDSLAVIKKLVFDEKKLTLKELKAALAANWEGHEDIRDMCLKAPKFGNDDDYVDTIARDLYQFLVDTTGKIDSVMGGKMKAVAVAHTRWRGGELGQYVGATLDGRYSGEGLADDTVAPMAGMDKNGPWAVLRSALKVDQVLLHTIVMGMNIHPSVLETAEGVNQLCNMVKYYAANGGRFIQFNIVSREILLDAQKNPEKYRDLVVNTGNNHWAYYVQLHKEVQDRLILRTAHKKL